MGEQRSIYRVFEQEPEPEGPRRPHRLPWLILLIAVLGFGAALTVLSQRALPGFPAVTAEPPQPTATAPLVAEVSPRVEPAAPAALAPAPPDPTPSLVARSVIVRPPQPPGPSPLRAAAVARPQAEAAVPLASLGAGERKRSPRDMKLLVIAADGQDNDLPALTAAADQLGVPYDVLIARDTPLVEAMLWDGAAHGYYQGILLASGGLSYVDPATGQTRGAFDDDEWAILQGYEAVFGVRQVSGYTNPAAAPAGAGLRVEGTQDTVVQPLRVTLTEVGEQVFPYLRASATIPVTLPPRAAGPNPPTYLATAASERTLPLLVTPQGHALASIAWYDDGRETLTLTTPNHPSILHSMVLSYGLIDWVARGVFLGERHANLGIQVDDLLAQSAVWDTSAVTYTTGLAYRMTGDDLRAAAAWQERVRASSSAKTLTLELAFNGRGGSGIFANDSLLPAVRAEEARFNWVNHTFSHQNLNAIPYEQTLDEIRRNNDYAREQLGLTNYHTDTLVQPDISGLLNPEFLRAAADLGIRYLVSDTSQPGWDNPSPNAGFYGEAEPSILIIPRRPAGVYAYNSRPEEWVSEYNFTYGPQGIMPAWDHDFTYQEILDKESDLLVRYLLKWDLDPLMFHQTNLRAYDGSHSVLGDVIEAALAKYDAVCRLPILNLTQREAGERMEQRMAYNAAHVVATLTPGSSITLTVAHAAAVPLTGVATGPKQERYGGQPISWVDVEPGEPVTIQLDH